MKTLRFLLQKEFIQIRRNAFLPKLIFVFPVMIMCVMPWVMSMEVKNIKVEVVDRSHNTASMQLIHRIQASDYFIFCGEKEDYKAALNDIDKGKADAVVVIDKKNILIAANAVNGTKGSIGSAYLSQIITASVPMDAEGGILAQERMIDNAPKILNLYNPHQNYKVYMIPALLAIVIMLMCGFLPALNIVGEKEAGTIEQINVTPVSKVTFILAKLIPYWIIALFIVTVCLLLSWGIYGITCKGNLWLVYLLAMLLSLFFSSFGLIISNYSDTMQQAIFVMWFFVVVLMLLSGLFTPTRSMPEWAYATTYVNPMHYFIDAIRTVFIRGGGLAGIYRQILALSVISLFMSIWAVLSYKKNN
ncbi:MAG: ABC transporter permease [Prevotella sp.]|nr:ABC transporter permease [Prevotella sp.]